MIAQAGNCVDCSCAHPTLRLNASSMSSTSFLVSLTVYLDSTQPYAFSALLDSGSSHCFISPKIIKKFSLPTQPVSPPCHLHMLDGQSSIYITQKLCIHITFTSGDTHPVTFFVAPLDSSCEAVLGLDWLVTYNPLVDWTTCWLTFHAG